MDAISPVVESLNNPNITYYKDKGCYKDNNILWCVYSLLTHNTRPEIPESCKEHKIGLFHGPIIGLYTDIGFEFEDGYSVEIFEGCDVVLAGDIHKRQTFKIPGNKKAYMVGSMINQNFGESIKNHGYGLYNVETKKYKFFNIDNPQPYLNFKIKDIEDIENGKEILTNA